MKRIILWTALAVLSAAQCFAACASGDNKKKDTRPVCDEWLMPEAGAYRTLGRRLTDVLMNAKSVKVYALAYKDTITPDDVEVEPHVVRSRLLSTLTAEQAAVLRYTLIANEANYHNDTSLIVMSPYLPVIEFEFTKKKETAHLFVSPGNYSWKVIFDDKQVLNYNYANGVFLKRFCAYFLNKGKDKDNSKNKKK